jgi:Ca2+-binding RTX toxin-like protein
MTSRPQRHRVRTVIAASTVLGSGLAGLIAASPAGAAPAVTHEPGQRVLSVSGDNADNTLVVSRDVEGHILVNGRPIKIHGVPATVTNVDELRVFGRAGNDTISLDETNGPLPQAQVFGGHGNDGITGGAEKDRLSGGDGNDLLEGGSGDEQLVGGDGKDFVDGNQGTDTALLGDGNDTFKWDPGDGSDRIEGQSGLDTMAFNGADAGESFDVAANGRRVTFTRDLGGITMDLNGIEVIATRTLGGADAFTAHDLSGTDVTALRIDEAASTGDPDGVADRVTLAGSPRDDLVSVSGSSAAVSVTGLPAAVQLTGTDPADGLEVDTGAGDDIVAGGRLQAGAVSLGVDGGDGNDLLVGGSGDDALHGGAGDDILVGGPGNDVLDGGSGANILIQ